MVAFLELEEPAVEPVPLAVLKTQLKLDQDDEDDVLAGLIRVARQHVERETGLVLISRKVRFYLDGWPQSGLLKLSRAPLVSVEALTYYDQKGLAQAFDLQGLEMDSASRVPRLYLSLPPASFRRLNGIELDVTLGFGVEPASVPAGLVQAILLHAGAMYGFRGVVALEDQPAIIPPGYDRLIAPYMRRRF